MKPIKKLPAGYSSPYGKVHNPNITAKPKAYMNSGFPLNSISVGHMVIDEQELCAKKAKVETKNE